MFQAEVIKAPPGTQQPPRDVLLSWEGGQQ